MRLPFVDREKEKARLSRLFSSGESGFCCIYGRRRCGKSRLLQEVLPRGHSVYFLSDEREPPLQREALARAMAGMLPGTDEVQYPEWASLFERWWREAPRGTVLALDEFPHLVKGSPEIPSILQRLIDQNGSRGLCLVICGSSQRMMQGLVLDGSAPLYGRAQEIIEVRPVAMSWLGVALGFRKAIDVLEAYAVWGGIPRYWELAADHDSTWRSVEELVLDPLGVLHDEPRRLLLDDMRDPVQAASILALVGSGCSRLSEIAGRLGKPATSLTRPVQRLLELRLLRREQPFGTSERSSKRTLYHVNDPFLRFWFRYVEPNRSRLEAGSVKQVRADVQRNFPNHMGAIWEDKVRAAFPRLNVAGLEWTPGRRWWGAGADRRPLEVDLLAESADGKVLFAGEAKLRMNSAEARRTAAKLEERVGRLPFAGSYARVITGVFVAERGRPAKVSSLLMDAEDVLAVCK